MDGLKPEFKEAINDAKDVYKKNLTHDLVTSLSMTAKGHAERVNGNGICAEPDARPKQADD